MAAAAAFAAAAGNGFGLDGFVAQYPAVLFRFGLVARGEDGAGGEVGEEGAGVFAAVHGFDLRGRLGDNHQTQTVAGDVGYAFLDGLDVAQCGKFVHQQQTLERQCGLAVCIEIVFRKTLGDVYLHKLAEKQIGQAAEGGGFGGVDADVYRHAFAAQIVEPEIVAGSGRFDNGIEKDAQRGGHGGENVCIGFSIAVGKAGKQGLAGVA